MKEVDLSIVKKILWLRLAQMTVNELYKNKEFVVPIHLALGHESLAVAVDSAMGNNDNLFLSHRNIHYNLTKMQSLKEELDEYYLRKSGIGKGQLGSMNLFNKDKNISYTTSILGNNLPVGCGFALGNKIKDENGVVFIVTGDGAVEEGDDEKVQVVAMACAFPRWERRAAPHGHNGLQDGNSSGNEVRQEGHWAGMHREEDRALHRRRRPPGHRAES